MKWTWTPTCWKSGSAVIERVIRIADGQFIYRAWTAEKAQEETHWPSFAEAEAWIAGQRDPERDQYQIGTERDGITGHQVDAVIFGHDHSRHDPRRDK
jgi:hypothetical protein